MSHCSSTFIRVENTCCSCCSSFACNLRLKMGPIHQSGAPRNHTYIGLKKTQFQFDAIFGCILWSLIVWGTTILNKPHWTTKRDLHFGDNIGIEAQALNPNDTVDPWWLEYLPINKIRKNISAPKSSQMLHGTGILTNNSSFKLMVH